MNYVNPFWEISDGAYIALFATMSEAIMDNKETVDKFIGDVVMAIWNAPGDAPDHVTNACRAALACSRIIAN